MRVVVALSGGKASAWCAQWAFNNYKKEDVILYFNDTRWEHPDLYRFLSDLSRYFCRSILWDSDGRSPEQLFFDKHALANNRMPFCSRILKAQRLQRFYKHGDVLVFGIGPAEEHRGVRLVGRYQTLAAKNKKVPTIKFPLMTDNVSSVDVDSWLRGIGIRPPILYDLGFTHNNCSGGCVRAGKKQWLRLLKTLPDVYADRERVEENFREQFKVDAHFFKDETLREFRLRAELGKLSSYYFDPEEDTVEPECIGVCDSLS